MLLDALLDEWGKEGFSVSLKQYLLDLPAGSLPLRKLAVYGGGAIDESDLSISVFNVAKEKDEITAKLGVYFTEVMSGCVCGDTDGLFDEPGYGSLLMRLDCVTGEFQFDVISDD